MINRIFDPMRTNGTSFHGDKVKATANELEAIIGEPSAEQNGYGEKTNIEWWFSIGDDVFTIYDWKEYRTIGMDEVIEWHIGGGVSTSHVKEIIVNLLNQSK